MSEALVGLLGVVFGIAITVLLHWLDKEARYRDITFEKRLSAHQEAYYQNQTMYEALNSNDKDEIHNKADDMKEWWKKNSLYLDNRSSQSMLALFSASLQYSLPPSNPQGAEKIWNLLEINLKDIINGIGAKHLPRIKGEDNETTTETKQSFIRSIVNKLKETRFLLPFVIAFVGGVIYILYIAFRIPLSDSYTMATQAKFVCYSIASTAALVTAFWATRNKWALLAIIIAIDFFLVGMGMELVDFILLSHS